MEVSLLLILWVVCAGLGGMITDSKGRGWGLGVVLGLLLGVLGVIITLFLSSKRDQRRFAAAPPDLARQQTSMYRECPHCREQMRRDASVCPHCRRESKPWQLYNGVWWVGDSTEGWYYLDEQGNRWRPHKVQAPEPPEQASPVAANPETTSNPNDPPLSPGGTMTSGPRSRHSSTV